MLAVHSVTRLRKLRHLVEVEVEEVGETVGMLLASQKFQRQDFVSSKGFKIIVNGGTHCNLF